MFILFTNFIIRGIFVLKLFGKKIRKSWCITFLIGAAIFGLFIGFNAFQKSIFSSMDFSDYAFLGGVSEKPAEVVDDINANVSPKIYDDDMCVHFINVGKADCAYIKCKDVNILIDAADLEPAGAVVEYLKRQKVEKLDLVVMSHPHRDHIGQMAGVIREFKVDKFIEADIPKSIIPITRTYENMLKALIEKQVPVESVSVGKSFKIGDLKIDILGPVRANKENMNDNSIVMKITYKDVSFLFTGDASKAEENDIIKHYGLSKFNLGKANENLKTNRKGIENSKTWAENNEEPQNVLKSDVLKVGHHGSNTSSAKKFLECVNPDYAVISTIEKSKPYIPSGWRWHTLERLEKCCDKIYKTYESGNIIFLTDGKTIKVETEK